MEINLSALKWLCDHSTLKPEDVVSRCPGISHGRMVSILRTAQAFPEEVTEIATAFSVPELVVTDTSGVALQDYIGFHQVLETVGDLKNTPFMDWAVKHAYATRKARGLPLDPKAMHEMYRRFKGI